MHHNPAAASKIKQTVRCAISPCHTISMVSFTNTGP